MGNEETFQLTSAFFGLTPQYRKNLFNKIHEIVFHGKGGYDYQTVYNMPIWLRNTTFNFIKEFYDKENERYKKSQEKSNSSTTVIDSEGKVTTPQFLKSKPSKKTSYK